MSQISGPEPVVVDYWATWCGPCKLIGPHFAKLEAKYPGVTFAKVDIEEVPVSVISCCPEISRSCRCWV